MVLNIDASLGLCGFKYIILCKSRCMVLCRCSLGLWFMQMQVYIYVGLYYGFIHRCMFRPLVLYISSLGLWVYADIYGYIYIWFNADASLGLWFYTYASLRLWFYAVAR